MRRHGLDAKKLMMLMGGGIPLAGPPPITDGLILDIDPGRGIYQDDAGTIPAISDGQTVGLLVDQAGSNSFIQATANKKPTLKTDGNGMNRKPILQFNGGQLLRAENCLTAGETGTIFVVFKPNLLDNFSVMFMSSDEASTTHRWMLAACDTTAAKQMQVLQIEGAASNKVSSKGALEAGTKYIGVVRSDGFEWQLRRNGAMTLPMIAGGVNNGGWWSDVTVRDNVVIGAVKHTSENYFYSGDIARILVYDSALSSADILSVESFLSNQYGIAVATEDCEYSKILITFDDSHGSVYEYGYLYAQPKGIKGTFYVNSAVVESTADDVTWSELGTMNTGGWDIGNHSQNHTDLDIEQALAEAELDGCRDDLDAHGLTRASSHVSYPHGKYDSRTLAAMAAQNMLTGRLATSGGYWSTPPDAYLISIQAAGGETFDASGYIADNITKYKYNNVIIFLFHRIDPTAAYLTAAKAEWEEFVDWLAASQHPCLTISELYAHYYS